MSDFVFGRSVEKNISNPIKKYIEPKKGQLIYFDNSIGEKGENVVLKQLLGIVLESNVFKLDGFSKTHNCYAKTNLVRRAYKDTLLLRENKGKGKTNKLLHEGVLGNQHDYDSFVAEFGQGKTFLTQCIHLYVADQENPSGGEVVCLEIQRSAKTAFKEQIGYKQHIGGKILYINSFIDKQNGGIDYKVPVFNIKDVPESEVWQKILEEAKVKHDELQEYLDNRMSNTEGDYQPVDVNTSMAHLEETVGAIESGYVPEDMTAEDDDLPF